MACPCRWRSLHSSNLAPLAFVLARRCRWPILPARRTGDEGSDAKDGLHPDLKNAGGTPQEADDPLPISRRYLTTCESSACFACSDVNAANYQPLRMSYAAPLDAASNGGPTLAASSPTGSTSTAMSARPALLRSARGWWPKAPISASRSMVADQDRHGTRDKVHGKAGASPHAAAASYPEHNRSAPPRPVQTQVRASFH